ncbi:hypothetical protein SEA_TOKKI_92 [Arthrobacter phage Tokki]|nr:hypothetical protein SEA_TOKKI_92 [Arthrobacter phage Tokki]
MSKIVPKAKVTIIVEGMEDIHKIVVPLATRPDVAVTDTYDIETGAPTDEKWFALGCYALYDINQHLVADQKKLTREQWENEIIDQARDILRERAKAPQSPSVETTSICVVKGEN